MPILDAPSWRSKIVLELYEKRQYRELIGSIDNEFHDVNTHKANTAIMHPEDYSTSALADA